MNRILQPTLISSCALLIGCTHPMLKPNYTYLNFIPSNHQVALQKSIPVYLSKNTEIPTPSQVFKKIPYNPKQQTILCCSPKHFCIIELLPHETIHDIALSDSKHWTLTPSWMGAQSQGRAMVILRPESLNLASDLLITTNKSSYLIQLHSKAGLPTQVIQFVSTPASNVVIKKSLTIDKHHLNFNYVMTGNHPAWQPKRIFDDGAKTFIQMTPIIDRVNLPILYVEQDHHWQLVNYRYHRPYYIVDGLFPRLRLSSGKGKEASIVILINHAFQS